MAYRFSQSRQIGEALSRDSLRQIAVQADYTRQEGTPVIVFNPLGWARQEIAEAQIDFEFDDPKVDNFQIVNAAGEVVPHQVVSDDQSFWMEVLKPNRKRRVRVLTPVSAPGGGYTTLYVQPNAGHPAPAPWLKVTDRGAENRYLAFSIAADGGLTVADKATGQTYSGLNHFYDVEDAGDEYSYCPCANSQTIRTVGKPAVITQVESGPCRAAFRITWELPIPARLSADRQRRSGETVILPITSDVYLYADQPGLYISTSIRNAAHDHKLTVDFPTGLHAAQVYVDESFMVAARDLALPPSEGWVEDPTPLMHQRTFTDLSQGDRGLAILNRGLPSVEVTADGTIALTLLRSVGWLSRDDLTTRRVAAGPLVPTPGAQCLGEYHYEYAILPHSGGWQAVYPVAYGYNAPLLARRADTHPGLDLREMNITRDDPSLVRLREWPRGGPKPDTWSLVQIDAPQLVLSALYRSGDNLIVRCYNVTRQPVMASIVFGLPIQAVYRVNMAEEAQEQLSVIDRYQVPVTVRGAEVLTLQVVPAR
ncbi:MAG TPA: glycoside hydrolase family 38 C-terminal domain-containing protein, partial [Aggregatilineales bacterium]|nr:glycoside hydrolase family 38 C-terminal domain-containing protein [Aggregatilineales bacterium]